MLESTAQVEVILSIDRHFLGHRILRQPCFPKGVQIGAEAVVPDPLKIEQSNRIVINL